MKKSLYIAILFCTAFLQEARSQYNVNWHIGNLSGISFATGIPQRATSSMQAVEGVATISDEAGNLLFYCNGIKIWNRNHAVMPNGNGIGGHLSSSQGVVIIPVPKSRKYFVFTVTASESQEGTVKYSVVDMDLNGGLGDVDPSFKNIPIALDNTERLAVALGPGCDYWLISHKKNIPEIEARLINENGVNNIVTSTTTPTQQELFGHMKFTADDKRMVVAVSKFVNSTLLNGHVELMEFNNQTGRFSNLIRLPLFEDALTYSACFSPDGQKLYVAESKKNLLTNYYQFDLAVYDSASIANSKTLIGSAHAASTVNSAGYTVSDLQLGPDGKIYFTRFWTNCLGVIPDPNLPAPLCGFNAYAMCDVTNASASLPNDLRVHRQPPPFSLGADTSLCTGSTLILNAPAAATAYRWSTGQTTPSITVFTPGTYWVEISNGRCTTADTIKVSFAHREVSLGNDTSMCLGSSVPLQAGSYSSYLWQDGSTGPDFTATAPGLYWVEATDACGRRSRDSVVITERRYNVSLGPDRTLCSGQSLTLQATGNFSSFTWGPQYNLTPSTASAATVFPASDTSYHVRAEAEPGCFAYDTIRITVVPAQSVQLPTDTTICAGSTLQLDAGPGFTSYLWQDRTTRSFIRVNDTALYWVETKDRNGCSSRDSIQVYWKDCGQAMWIPNSFTPNGDGKNDIFRVRYTGAVSHFRLSVYNRWGQVVFTTSDPGRGWDGTISGATMDTGVFVWMCTYKLYNREPVTEKGTVTLVR